MISSTAWDATRQARRTLCRSICGIAVLGLSLVSPVNAQAGARVSDDRVREFGRRLALAIPDTSPGMRSLRARSARNARMLREPTWRAGQDAWDLSLGLAAQTSGVSENASLGFTIQWARPLRRFLRFGIQGGANITLPTGDICNLLPDGRCEREVPSTLHLAPLVGVGYAAGPAEVRVMAGPRVVAATERPFAGTQVTADLALGGPRVSLLVPITWAWTRSTDRQFDNRTIGVGVRLH